MGTRIGQGNRNLALGLIIAVMLLTGCAAGHPAKTATYSDNGELLAQAKGRVVQINRRAGWFEIKPRSGVPLSLSYDANTTLLDFPEMKEIKLDQPVEVIYFPLGVEPFRAISIKKLAPGGCG